MERKTLLISFTVLFILFFLIYSCTNIQKEKIPIVAKGEIDLRNWDFEKNGSTNLDGKWEFYWEKLLGPTDFNNQKKIPPLTGYITIPGVWNGYIDNKKEIPGQGYATYRLIVKINRTKDVFGLRIPSSSTSSIVWINGDKIASTGKVGTSKKTSKPHYQTIDVYFNTPDDRIEIIFQIANYYYWKGGLWQTLRIGKAKDISIENTKQTAINFVLFGSLLIMAFYHFGLFLLRKKDSSTIFFGLFCLAIATRIMVTGELLLTNIFPDFWWEAIIKIELSSITIGYILFAKFLNIVISKIIPKVIYYALLVVMGVFTLIFIILPAIMSSIFIVPMQISLLILSTIIIIFIIIGIFQRKEGTIIILIGVFALFIAVINDILFTNYIINTTHLFPAGVFIFFFCQSFLLSVKFSRAFTNVEVLSEDLKLTNTAFSRFVPSEFIRYLNKKSIVDVKLGDQKLKRMSILFSDIRSFTSLSEQMSPQENINFLNSYLKRINPIVKRNNGFIDKYIGESVMALFSDKAEDALNTAIAIQKEVKNYNKDRKESGYKPINIGIGIHIGNLMLGTIGETNRMQTTVISDAVNLTARLEGLTKIFHSKIIISKELFLDLKNPNDYKYRFLGKVKVKGKMQSTSIFEILDVLEEKELQSKLETLTSFEKAINLYQIKEFTESYNIFKELSESSQEDKAALLYLNKCRELIETEIPKDWEGDFKLEYQ